MKTLVVSGTGTIGSRVAQKLMGHGSTEVQITSRTPQNSSVNSVYMDFGRPESMAAALKGQTKVCLITPASPTEGQDGGRFVEEARRAGVKKVVFLSIHNVRKAPSIPHFKSKIDIQQALASSGMEWTLVAANNFYQNDLWFKEAMMEFGVYPQPFGNKGLSRVDADDVATAIVHALGSDLFSGCEIPLVGPEALTAERTVELYSRALNKKIQYLGDDLDVWEKESLKMLPAWLVEDWKKMYAFFQAEGLRASAEDLLKQSEILQRPPRSFESFVQATAQTWKK